MKNQMTIVLTLDETDIKHNRPKSCLQSIATDPLPLGLSILKHEMLITQNFCCNHFICTRRGKYVEEIQPFLKATDNRELIVETSLLRYGISFITK